MEWELDYKESWTLKKWCFWTVVLEKTLESPLDIKDIKPVNPKGNRSWELIGRTDAETEAQILWPPDAKSQLIGKYYDARKDWRQKEKRVAEDGMVGWHPQVNGHEFKQIPGESDGQGSLVCCSPWGHKELDTTEWLNNNKTPDYHIPLNTNVCSSERPSLATPDTVDPCFKTFHVIKFVWHDMYHCLNFLLMN